MMERGAVFRIALSITSTALIALALPLAPATAQERDGAEAPSQLPLGEATNGVANFGLADHDYGSPAFEKLTFRNGPEGKSIVYAYGPDARTVRLQLLGPSPDGNGLAVQFPNGLVLDIVPRGDRLEVSDRRGTYRKSFSWLYEGPVDGRGTACTSCVPEAEAITFVQQQFLAITAKPITGRFRVGKTGIYCVRAPCPWRGITPADADGQPLGRPIWASEEPPALRASSADRKRILSAWNDFQCLIVDGAIEGDILRVRQISGTC